MGIAMVVLAGCSARAASPTELPEASVASVSPTAAGTPTLVPSQTPGEVNITFQIMFSGSVPTGATIALQTNVVPYQGPGSGAANYLCSPDVGRISCEGGKSYEEADVFLSGTQVHYVFWRELDANGASEIIKEGQLTVGQQDSVISVTYDFPS